MRSPRLLAVLLSGLLILLLLPISASAAVPDAQGDTATVAEDSGATDIDVLANDLTDAGTNVVTDATGGAHGTVTFDDNGVAYTPATDYFGTDSFTYTVTNDDGPSTATVDVTVTAVNDPPSFTPGDDVTVDEDSGPAVIPNWATGFDPGPSNESAQVIHFTVAVPNAEKNLFSGQPAIGAENTANPGRLTFTPAANAHGVAHVTVTAVDNGGTPGDSTGTPQILTITITSQNDPPHADDDTLTIAEDDGATAVNVLAGDTDPEGDALEITTVTQGAKGTVVITGGGAGVTYEPDANANGTDSFTYTIDDGNGGTDTATVHVTITPVNDKPHADDDAKTLDEDSGATAIDVLGNDDDIDGNALDITSVTQGTKGTIAITGGGTGLTYTPDPNANGSDSFSYTISDGHGMSDTADVSITIDPKNDPPVVAGDSATMNEDAGATVIDVLGNDSDIDGDTLTITATTDGASGVVTITGGGSGLTYRPNDQFHGTDSFTYTVSDGTVTRTATVSVTVTSVNDDPAADDDDFGVMEDAPLPTQFSPLAGDSDIDGDTLTITSVTQGSKGAAAIVAGGLAITYRPFSNLSGVDTFTYTISDGHGGTATATVTMTIGGSNDPPDAVNDLGLNVAEGAGATALDVLGNDDDPDGNDLTIKSATSGAHGTVTITGNGTGIAYRPAKWFQGTDTFTYTVDDGHGATDHATVQVIVDKDVAGPIAVAPVQRFPGQTLATSSAKTRISWAATDPGSGVTGYVLQVSVNGGAFKTVRLATITSTWVDETLAYGRTYRFRVRAFDHEGNVGAYAYGPTFRLGKYEESNPAITYTTGWGTLKRTAALGGAVRFTGAGNRASTLTTAATDIALVVTRTSTSGRVQVYVDGIPVATVTLRRSTTAYRQLVYTRHFATLGVHTFEIRAVGDGRVELDAFEVMR